MRKLIAGALGALAIIAMSCAPASADAFDVSPSYSFTPSSSGQGDVPFSLAVDQNGDLWEGTISGRLRHLVLDDQGDVDSVSECIVFDAADEYARALFGFDFDSNGNAYVATGPGGVGVVPARELSRCQNGAHVLMTSSVSSPFPSDAKLHGDYLYVAANTNGVVEVYKVSPSLALYAFVRLDVVSPSGIAIGDENFAVTESHGFGGMTQIAFADVEGHGDVNTPPTLTPTPVTTVAGPSPPTNGLGGEDYYAYGSRCTLVVTVNSNGDFYPVVQFAPEASGAGAAYLAALAGPMSTLQRPEGIVFDRAGRMWLADPVAGSITRFDNALSCVAYDKRTVELANTGLDAGASGWAAGLAVLAIVLGLGLAGRKRHSS